MASEKASMKASGLNGQVELFGDRVRIRRKGILSFIYNWWRSRRDIDIPFSDISSIQFKNVGFPANGYIRFVRVGERGDRRSIFFAGWDKNTVIYVRYQRGKFKEIERAIEDRMKRHSITG